MMGRLNIRAPRQESYLDAEIRAIRLGRAKAIDEAEAAARAKKLAAWADAIAERDEDGLLTPLALALDAIRDRGCDCGEEPGTCITHVCEAALRDLWEQRNDARDEVAAGAAMLARQTDLAKEAEAKRDQFARALQSSHAEWSKHAEALDDIAQTLLDVHKIAARIPDRKLSAIIGEVNWIEKATARLADMILAMRVPHPEDKP
jgi:hypothetical protein